MKVLANDGISESGVSVLENAGFNVITEKVNQEDLINYTKNDKHFDKAGSYGIQDWFGLIAVESLNGSYSNIVGFRTY